MSSALSQGPRGLVKFITFFRFRSCCGRCYFQQHGTKPSSFSPQFSPTSKPVFFARPSQLGNTCIGRGIRQNTTRPKETPSGKGSASNSRLSLLLKPFVFTLTVSGCSFAGAAIWQYENLRSLLTRKQRDLELQYGKLGSLRQHVNYYWNALDPSRRTVACVIVANVAVFLLWRLAPAALMHKWFASNPYTGARCWSMLLSTFSHHNFLHLFVNMYVLWSFAPAITHVFGKEQFLGMYLSAGVVSSFASYVHKVIRPTGAPSLGASGAIYAVLGAVCTQMPESRLQIALIGELIPHSFTAQNAMAGLIIFDTLGLIFRWRLFDHAAHLGGLLFGMWYASYGHKLVWKSREPLIKWYHERRNSKS